MYILDILHCTLDIIYWMLDIVLGRLDVGSAMSNHTRVRYSKGFVWSIYKFYRYGIVRLMSSTLVVGMSILLSFAVLGAGSG